MTTLFLLPNDNPPLARRFHERIESAGGVPGGWAVECTPCAPQVIASPEDDRRAAAAAAAHLRTQGARWSRVVLMSSVDTGYDEVQAQAGIEAFGFTRCVLGWHRSQGRTLEVVTFGRAMTARYERIFREHEGVVQGHAVLDVSPAALASSSPAEVAAVARLCDVRHEASGAPVFLVGALALDLADRLRSDSRGWIVDPVADALAFLRRAAAPARPPH